MSVETETTEANYRLPGDTTLKHVAKLGVVEDKPIMFDYWTASVDKNVIIGVRDNGEKLLVKSEDEYTSPVAKIYKVEDEYIIITENSIYVYLFLDFFKSFRFVSFVKDSIFSIVFLLLFLKSILYSGITSELS